MKILTAAQMREIDRRTTAEAGVSSLQLMENAGAAVVEAMRQRTPDLARKKIAVLCGKGNNGGDGFVVARLLRDAGAAPRVYLFAAGDAVKGDAAANLQRWRQAGGEIQCIVSEQNWRDSRQDVLDADVMVDALLGSGLSGPVQGLLSAVIDDVNQHRRGKLVAVDIPSGLPSEGPVFGPSMSLSQKGDYTVTFTAPKLGQFIEPNRAHIGELLVRQIGTPREMLENDASLKLHRSEPREFRSLDFTRQPGSHKGDYGHALLVAGSRGKTGAAVLAAEAALRAGAGLVTVATPESVLPIVAGMLPEMMTEPLSSTDVGTIGMASLEYGRFTRLLEGKNVLAIGPGLSTNPETQQFVRSVVRDCALPLILDADALNAFSASPDELKQHRSPVMAVTPHPGEMARLLGCATEEVQRRRTDVAAECAARWNAFVVLKGFQTVITAPDGRTFVNSTGNPGMATGGTGDVLTGMLAGLTAQFGTGDWATVLAFGVYLHGLAGDLAAAEVGQQALIASDLLRVLPRAWQRLIGEIRASG